MERVTSAATAAASSAATAMARGSRRGRAGSRRRVLDPARDLPLGLGDEPVAAASSRSRTGNTSTRAARDASARSPLAKSARRVLVLDLREEEPQLGDLAALGRAVVHRLEADSASPAFFDARRSSLPPRAGGPRPPR